MATITRCLAIGPKIDEVTALDLIRKMEAISEDRPQPAAVRIHVCSTGGKTAFGLLLYHYFRNYPLELTAVNMGRVESAATIAFLGARNRMAINDATFMIHRVSRLSS